MGLDATPLTEDERRELEELRAQKRAREEAERAARERRELELLRSEQAQASKTQEPPTSDSAANSEALMREQVARERGRKLVEPDDDLSMPLGQKIVLATVFLIVIGFVVAVLYMRG